MRGRWLAALLLASSAALCCGISGMRFRAPGQSGGASQLQQLRGRRGNGLAINISARNFSSPAFAAADMLPTELSFAERMAAGGIARAVSMAVTYPLNAYKTYMNLNRSPQSLSTRHLFRGIDAQLALGLPVGALQMAAMDTIRGRLQNLMPRQGMKMGVDFLSGALATTMCSVLSMPETVITHRMMAGTYPSLATAVRSIYRNEGIRGFYTGLVPTLAHQIPAQGLNWALFEQFKRAFTKVSQRPANPFEGLALASLASAATSTLLAPLDTVKTRMIALGPYATNNRSFLGVFGAVSKISKQEGVRSLYRCVFDINPCVDSSRCDKLAHAWGVCYLGFVGVLRGLPARLLSVVPLVAVQLGVYETAKQQMLALKRRRQFNQMFAEHRSDILAGRAPQ